MVSTFAGFSIVRVSFNQPLVLASASPRRRALLSSLGIPFEVEPSGLDERPWPGEMPASYALRNASDKARAVALRRPDAVVLAADTIVVLGNRILEKPAHSAEAVAMLAELSGREHEVMTAVVVRFPRRDGFCEAGEVARTRVWFRTLSRDEIDHYVATGEPLDKAGAYAIQGGAASFVARIDGPYDNVVGLPLEIVRRLLCRVRAATNDGV